MVKPTFWGNHRESQNGIFSDFLVQNAGDAIGGAPLPWVGMEATMRIGLQHDVYLVR